MQTGEKNFLQAVLQDAEDQLRVLAFLLRHAQQHAPVRPGILGERGVGLVRGVLRDPAAVYQRSRGWIPDRSFF